MIAIFYALSAEIKELKKAPGFTALSSSGARPLRANYQGRDLLLVATGVGPARARQSAERILQDYPVSAVISTGFAGALNAKTRAGDVVIALQIQPEQMAPDERVLPAAGSLVVAARSIHRYDGFQILVGSGVTSAQVCATPRAKRRLCSVFHADFVDMESYWIGRCAAARQLSFITVRAVSDSVDDDLSFIDAVTAAGKISPARTFRHFLTHPYAVPRTISLAGQMHRAGRNLAWFLARLLPVIDSPGNHLAQGGPQK
jgi:adenosylhomocysteine nucleosidase